MITLFSEIKLAMKTKYIFLNPEGVIRQGCNGQGWNPQCVENLCIVIGTTGAFIVLTGYMKESPSGPPWPFGRALKKGSI